MPAQLSSQQTSDALREAILERGLTAERGVALAEALEAEGHFLGALRALHGAVQLRRDPALEKWLLQLRYAAYPELDCSRYPRSWPPGVEPDRLNAVDSPKLSPEAMTVQNVAAVIRRYGCAWIPGLIPADRVTRLRERIDRVFEAREANRVGGEEQADFQNRRIPGDKKGKLFSGGNAAVLLPYAPRALHDFLETATDAGLIELAGRYLGEPPVLAAQKGTLRRVGSDSDGAWHQDGAFMDAGVRTLNVWTALSDCGGDAPGLDIIPERLERILPTGEEGTAFDWTVSPKTIERELPGVPVWRPRFKAGDVLLFDHLCLHATAVEASMPNTRYAVESWFFAASHISRRYTPIVV